MHTEPNQDFPLIRSRSHLIENMRFVYALIVASEDLTRLAARTSGSYYFAEKLREETGHAEWLLDDLKGLGADAPQVDHDAACIAGAQFYYITYVSPHMLLGYMAALESSPMPMDDVQKLETLYGPLPTLRYHAEHDVSHALEVQAEIAKLSEDMQLKVAYNERCTRAHIASVLKARFERCDHAVH